MIFQIYIFLSFKRSKLHRFNLNIHIQFHQFLIPFFQNHVIRNIISWNQPQISAAYYYIFIPAKHLIPKILLKSFRNISDYNCETQLEILEKKNSLYFILESSRKPSTSPRSAIFLIVERRRFIRQPSKGRSSLFDRDLFRRKDVAGHMRPWSMALDISGARSP